MKCSRKNSELPLRWGSSLFSRDTLFQKNRRSIAKYVIESIGLCEAISLSPNLVKSAMRLFVVLAFIGLLFLIETGVS